MDFIERLFRIAPDGGNGVLELSLLFAGVALVLGLLIHKRTERGSVPVLTSRITPGG
jgi:hypothetical protein